MSPGEQEAVDAAKACLSPERMWQGSFTKPSQYRLSTLFGVKRAVNGRMLKDYFHSGLDFAAPAGAPVVATANGTVILAAQGWRLHGNCVALDHGQGVVSFYIHLKTLAVTKGQSVKAGDKIGTVGQTGRANGPHLHFSIYVNKVATNPLDWFTRTF
jgi:murein DD-endopeptidase MepM/ murein hydrolase activator NlpD